MRRRGTDGLGVGEWSDVPADVTMGGRKQEPRKGECGIDGCRLCSLPRSTKGTSRNAGEEENT